MSVDPLSTVAQRPGGTIAALRGRRAADRSRPDGRSPFWRMLTLVRPHWRALTLGLVLSFGVALTYAASLVGMLPVLSVLLEKKDLRGYLLEKATEYATHSDPRAWLEGLLRWLSGVFPAASAPNAAMTSLLILVGAIVVLNLVGNFLRFLSQYLVLYACNRMLMDLRRQMYRKALLLPSSTLTGDVSTTISQFLSDVREVYVGVATLFGKVAREPLKAICVFAAALWMDWRLTLVVVAIAPIAIGVLGYFGRKVRKATIRLLQGYGQMLTSLEESLQGLDVVKGYAREGYERRRMWQLERRMFGQQMRLSLIEALSSPLIEVLGLFVAAAGIVWLASRTFSGEISANQFLTMVALLAAMLDPVRKVANVYNMVQRAGAASERIFDTLDHPDEATPASPKPMPQVAPEVRLEGITFRYNPSAPPALNDVNLHVRPGECLAIVGPNGSGKTTLVRLLPRLLVAQSGRVTVDGVGLHEVSLKQLRKRIAVVTQRAVIFARTVRENIAYGKPDATPAEVAAAAAKAHAAEFVEQWPQRYETVLGEGGTTMSGGQAQRIAIARAFLKPATILIFDEATSQVDVDSERKIHAALNDLRQGKTTFLIAHRHTVMDMADRIAVMDAGRIVDIGTREELLARCPLFVALYRSPMAR